MKFGIVIPTLNRADLLKEAIDSLDKQYNEFDKLLIIDNGKQNIDISDTNMWKTNKAIIHETSHNLGVGPSWNLGINTFKNFDYILFLNDDVVLGPDQVKTIRRSLDEHWLTTGTYYWSVFSMKQDCWNYFLKTDGHVFDEKFYPAYYEDNDFAYRLTLKGEDLRDVKEIYDPVVKRNSMTIAKDPGINSNFEKNKQYFIQKWGGIPGHEQYKTAFNK